MTLFELLGGVLAIALVVAVVTRVYGSELDAAQGASLKRLSRIHRAATIYRSDNGGVWPTSEAVYNDFLGYDAKYFVSPCANKAGYLPRRSGVSYMYLWSRKRDIIFANHPDNAPLFVDLDCNPSHRPKSRTPKIGLGVAASGRTIRLQKTGDARRWGWWMTGIEY
jgi:hypothetical protein